MHPHVLSQPYRLDIIANRTVLLLPNLGDCASAANNASRRNLGLDIRPSMEPAAKGDMFLKKIVG